MAERRLADAELREAQDSLQARAVRVQSVRPRLCACARCAVPVSGVVVDRYMHPGEISEVGAKPILKLAEISTLHVEAILPMSAYGQIAQG